MADPIIGNNVRIEVEATATPSLTISAITKANPAVVTFTEDTTGDPQNGDIIVLQDVEGMDELNGQVARVAGRAGSGASSTLQLEGIDSTSFGTFTSGTFKTVLTFVSFDKARTWNAQNAAPTTIDVTTLKDRRAKVVYGTPGAITGDFTALLNPGGDAEAELIEATNSQTTRAIRITYADSRKTLMNARIVFGGGFGLSPNAPAESNGNLTVEGAVGIVHYAT